MDHVLSFERLIGNGSTDPLIGIISKDGEHVKAVIKTKDNSQGVLTLINEFICYHLGKNLGLKMPPSGVAFIGDECETNNFITDADKGHCFYSEYIKSLVPNPGIISNVINKDVFSQIIIFDHLTYNSDRNPGNLLISSSKGDKILYAIDHTHVFKNQAIWDSQCLITGSEENDYLDTRIMKDNSAIYSMFWSSNYINQESLKGVVENYNTIISRELLTNIINDLPDDWHIESKNLDALIDYILYRLSKLDLISEMIIRYIEKGE